MKLSVFLVVAASAYVLAVPAVPVQEEGAIGVEKTYPRYVEIPDGEGNMHTVDLEAEPDQEALNDMMRNSDNNAYLLYTRRNRVNFQTLEMNNADSIRTSNFNPALPTVFIVHGWLSSRYSEPNRSVRNAYLDKSDVNVIVVCWRLRAILDYATAVRGVPTVGQGLGQFILFLNRATGAAFDQMHLIGFSLGAHVVGNAGREIGGRAARVTGLDPAGPLWNTNSNRLSPLDGVYVEAIHTDGSGLSALGIGSAIAQVDFFPNGGGNQPGCITGVCNHNRAWELFAASVTYNHLIGSECSNNLQLTLNTCRGQLLQLGNDDLKKTGRGMYRLDTGRRYPY